MTIIKSPYFPTSNCVATFGFSIPKGKYTGFKFKPATMNRFRYILDGYASPWTDSTDEQFTFPQVYDINYMVLQFSKLTPIRMQPTQWTNLDILPLLHPKLQTKQAFKPEESPKNKQTLLTKSAPYAKPLAPKIQKQTTMPIAGHGYITSTNSQISYEEIEMTNANAQNRGWDIDFSSNYMQGCSFPEEEMGLAYWAGLSDLVLFPYKITAFPENWQEWFNGTNSL